MTEKPSKLEQRIQKIADTVGNRAMEIIQLETSTMKERLANIKKMMAESIEELRATTVLEVDDLVFAKSFKIVDHGEVTIRRSYNNVDIYQTREGRQSNYSLPIPKDMPLSVKIIITEPEQGADDK